MASRHFKIELGAYAAGDADNIATAQNPATALLRNLTLLSTPVELDEEREVFVTSVGNAAAARFFVRGTNANGQQVVDSFLGANAGAAVSKVAFKTVVEVQVIGLTNGNVSVGAGRAAGSGVLTTNWRVLDALNNSDGVSVQTYSTGGSAINFDVQVTLSDPTWPYDVVGHLARTQQPQFASWQQQAQSQIALPAHLPTALDGVTTVGSLVRLEGPLHAIRLVSNSVITAGAAGIIVSQSQK